MASGGGSEHASVPGSRRRHIVVLIALHVLLGVYSFSGVFSKAAALAGFPTATFFICYGFVLLLLAIYAIGWQQVIKRIPLTSAFANKAITVVWGIFWGILFFGERLTVGKAVGAAIIIAGIVLFAYADRDDVHG